MNIRQQNAVTLPVAAGRRFANGSILTLTLVMIFTLGASMALAQVPLINAPLVPEQKKPGSAQFTMTVNGTGFASDAVVNWNGTPLATTFVTAEKVTAVVPAADLATASTAIVTVTNGTGPASNAGYFEVVTSGFTVAWATSDYATDTTPQDVTTAEFTGSGHLDLAVATGNNTVSMLLGTGTGTFPTHVQYAVPGNPVAIIHGDFNGDGKMDVATADQYGSEISVLLGNGDGTLQGHKEYSTGNEPLQLATADVNGDGKLDIVTANYNANTVSVLLGNGDGTFKTHVDYKTGNGPSSVAIGDFNGDGKLDLVVVNNTDSTVSILLGNGDGTFQTAVPYNTAVNPNSVVVGDFTGSGTLDLAVGTSNKSVSVLLGNGNGTFQNHIEYTIGANAVVVAAADLNSSGKLSLVSANYTDNTVSVLVSNGNGTFKSESVFPTNGGPSGIAVGDFNDDGKLDIAATDTSANMVSVLLDTPITISPTLLPFSVQTSGDKSPAKTITIKNTGTSTYTFGSPSWVGAYYSDFSETNTCTATLAAGKTCTYSVYFDPQASETANAQYLLTPTGGANYIGWQMTGSGNIPIMLTPRTQTFSGFQLDGTCSKGKTNTFTNESGVDIYFTSISQTGVGDAEYTFTSTCAGGGPPFNYATPLLPGASCVSTVEFCPTTSFGSGGADTTFIYTGNFTESPQGLLISAEATGMSVTPATLAFPSTKVGVTSAPLNITVKNASTSAITFSSETFSGSSPYWALDTAATTCPTVNGKTFAASSTCVYAITFTPEAAGSFTATWKLGDNDAAGPQTVNLTGTGTN